jgi:hypothetical protein
MREKRSAFEAWGGNERVGYATKWHPNLEKCRDSYLAGHAYKVPSAPMDHIRVPSDYSGELPEWCEWAQCSNCTLDCHGYPPTGYEVGKACYAWHPKPPEAAAPPKEPEPKFQKACLNCKWLRPADHFVRANGHRPAGNRCMRACGTDAITIGMCGPEREWAFWEPKPPSKLSQGIICDDVVDEKPAIGTRLREAGGKEWAVYGYRESPVGLEMHIRSGSRLGFIRWPLTNPDQWQILPDEKPKPCGKCPYLQVSGNEDWCVLFRNSPDKHPTCGIRGTHT